MLFKYSEIKPTLSLVFFIIISSFLASVAQTNFNKTHIETKKLFTIDDQFIVYDLYKPKLASKDNKLPYVVIVPGFQRSKEALSNFAIELSRRDIVVALIDPYAQGLSSSSRQRRSATKEGYGMFDLINHVHGSEDYDFVDKTKMGVTGHSMGGNAAIRGANYFGKEAIRLNEESKLHSIYISGYVLSLRNSILKHFKSNAGVSYALYDEGAFRNKLKGWDAANMQIAPESLRFVNWGIYNKARGETKIELGKYYGNAKDRSLRVVHNEPVLHPFQPYNFEAMQNQIEFFVKTFEINPSLTSKNQIWHWKELFTLLNMIAALIMIIPLTKLILGFGFFKTIKKVIPNPLPRPNKTGRLIFWFVFFLGAGIASVTFIPMVEVAKILFPEASNREMTWFFPQRMNNSVMLWAVFNGLVGFFLFFSSYYFHGRKHGITPVNWGINISLIDFSKTIILSFLIFGIFYVFLNIIYALFHVDYRFWFMGVRIFQLEMLLVLLMYAPFFYVFFLSNSLRVNGSMRVKDQPEWLSMLIGGFGNSLGLMIIILIQYLVFASTGTVFWTTNWLSVNLLFAIVPMMFVLPYFNRYFFNMSGQIYLGPMITTLVFIMILSTNTVLYLPL
jgi:hypothetical protein